MEKELEKMRRGKQEAPAAHLVGELEKMRKELEKTKQEKLDADREREEAERERREAQSKAEQLEESMRELELQRKEADAHVQKVMAQLETEKVSECRGFVDQQTEWCWLIVKSEKID